MIRIIEVIRNIAFNVALLTDQSAAHNLLERANFTCIARTAYGEARGEGMDGMALVVQSIVNRQRINKHAGCRIANHAYEGFRTWRGRNIRKIDADGWQTARFVTLMVLIGEYDLGDCSDATHFLNPKAVRRMPSWANDKNEVCSIGNHVAYRVANL